MLKFVLLSALLGASLAMNVENVENVENAEEGANLSDRDHRSLCGSSGCTQTTDCTSPANAEGYCTKYPTWCADQTTDFYVANNAQCNNGCHCVMKCRPKAECEDNGGHCVSRKKSCPRGYTKKDCGCKTKNKCSCCVPHAKAHKLSC